MSLKNRIDDHMVTFLDARKLYNSGKYKDALYTYLELANIYGSDIVNIELEKCRNKLGNINENTTSLEELIIKKDILSSNNDILSLIKQVDNYYNSSQNLKNKPLVSVIITSHNTEKYIESSINSILEQSYDKIEIIVVDDNSTDKTVVILDRLSKFYKNLKFIQLNSNLGTYYAKNIGILNSKGDIIFFHDSDDICHRNRIELSLKALEDKEGAIAVRSAYARINPNNLQVVQVDSLDYKLGLITLGVKREVFNKIGFFNCTTKASDDEFFNRLKNYYKKDKIAEIMQPLYFNTMREGSLISDMVDWTGENYIYQNTSLSRSNYVKVFKDFHSRNHIDFAEKFIFPNIRDILPVESDMTKLSNPSIPVYINICSIPQREQKLQKVIEVLLNQCDFIHVYLDGYKQVPSFLKHKKITVIQSSGSESLRDNGKFILLEELVSQNKDGYYFTVDDDINYPLDYVNTMIKKLNYYHDSVVLGVHGVIIPYNSDRYFSKRRKVFAFYRKLEIDKIVSLLGTGTVAFRVNKFHSFKLSNFYYTGMADIFFANECNKNKLPMITISRHDSWLYEMEKNTPTLFGEFKSDDTKQTQIMKVYGLDRYKSKNDFNISEELEALLPRLNALEFL
ncbi:glycosyltransferase family 2 protein [Actinobacillus ureae]|uniref:glycosyltransferase family 2 protein n=2 Tax=Actinobacillus ureae TaxID=723 RepID=UPI0011C04422|nr:glycosyltransferase family A protein [Actinobacillus ureae]